MGRRKKLKAAKLEEMRQFVDHIGVEGRMLRQGSREFERSLRQLAESVALEELSPKKGKPS